MAWLLSPYQAQLIKSKENLESADSTSQGKTTDIIVFVTIVGLTNSILCATSWLRAILCDINFINLPRKPK